MGWTVRVLFEPRDVWIGVYWTPKKITRFFQDERRWRDCRDYEVYICLVPMLPIKIRWSNRRLCE